jgi:mRNA interferase RelE/StbE
MYCKHFIDIRIHVKNTTPFKKLKNKMAERLECPRVPSAALSSMADCYKIKLRGAVFRLVYRVDEEAMFVRCLP